MVNSISVYRVYANTYSSLQYLPYANIDNELQIVLPFARAYDAAGKNQTGKFEAYFDKTSFNASSIQTIKNNATSTSVKFFLSIGGRDSRFPFAATSADKSTWTKNAIDTLSGIVSTNGFDGIDVYYEHINSNAESQFASSIFDVIFQLKKKGVISTASITVSARLKDKYHALYAKNDKLFDYVVYQTHSELSRISNIDDLPPVFDGLRYPNAKILAGYSDSPADWVNVAPPIFLGAVPQILNKGISTFSKWIVTPNDYNPEK